MCNWNLWRRDKEYGGSNSLRNSGLEFFKLIIDIKYRFKKFREYKEE